MDDRGLEDPYDTTIWFAGEYDNSWILRSENYFESGTCEDGERFEFDSYAKLLGAIKDKFERDQMRPEYQSLITEDVSEAVPATTTRPQVPADSDEAKAMIKLVEIAKALADRFGFDPKLVLQDMFNDLRLINGESVLAVLDPNNPIDQLTAEMYNDYKVFETVAEFFGENARNIMLKRVLESDPEECCNQFQKFIDSGHRIPFNGQGMIGRQNDDHLLEDVDDDFFNSTSGFWTWMVQECFLNEALEDYDPKEGWTDDDIMLHKSTDWKARNYEDFDTGEQIKGTVYIYREDGSEQLPNVTFHRFIRSNPIYPPYYKPVREPGMGLVGPMFDGRTHDRCEVLDRYESQEVYDKLSEGFEENLDEARREDPPKDPTAGLPPDLAQAYRGRHSQVSQDVPGNQEHGRISVRRKAPFDYAKAHYQKLSKEEALEMLKSRTNVESLRLVVPTRRGPGLIQFIDKGGYSGGKYYRPLYQLYYVDYLPDSCSFTNKKGNLEYDSRKIPVQHLVDIASSIYKTEDENPRTLPSSSSSAYKDIYVPVHYQRSADRSN